MGFGLELGEEWAVCEAVGVVERGVWGNGIVDCVMRGRLGIGTPFSGCRFGAARISFARGRLECAGKLGK